MAEALAKCDYCKKVETETLTLKTCSKCKKSKYCSRNCQKSDWKSHKVTCSEDASNAASKDEKKKSTASASSSKGNDPSNAFQKMLDGSWLHNLDEEMCFKALIDTFRMRIEDEYVWAGELDEDMIYGGASSSKKAFIKFLNMAESKPGLLPKWWSPVKRAECIAYGMRSDVWSSLRYAVEKHDIQDHYELPMAPMQFRVLAEQIYGTPIGSF